MLVEDAVPIVGDDDRCLGAADVDAGDQRPVEPRLIGRDHRTNPRPSCCSMSSADAPSTTTSSWTWPNSICVSRASECQDARPGVPPDLAEPVVAELRDRADQQHVANVEHADQPADRDTELARGIEDDPPDAGDAGQEGGDEAGLVGDRRLDGASGVDQRAHARHRLEAALPPAAARSVGAADRDMAELACAVTIALEQLAIEDDPGADPATHLDHDQVVRPRAAEGRSARRGRQT